MPTIAKWKFRNNKYRCSNCLMAPPFSIDYLCPNCGAIMSNYESILEEFYRLTNYENYDIIEEEKRKEAENNE